MMHVWIHDFCQGGGEKDFADIVQRRGKFGPQYRV